jgi:hypothetical protein
MTFCKTLDSMTFCSQRKLPTIQLFASAARHQEPCSMRKYDFLRISDDSDT